MNRFATFVMLVALVGFVGCGAPADLDPPPDGGEVNTIDTPATGDSESPDVTEPSTPDNSGPPTNFTPEEEKEDGDQP